MKQCFNLLSLVLMGTPWPKATLRKGLISFYTLQFSIDGNGAGTEGEFEPETMEEYCRLTGSPAYG